MESRTKEIAQTIIKQIQYTDRAAFMAWGSSYHCEVSESKEFQGGLSFMCNGLTHQGWVTIKLRWADDYTVIFTNRKREVVKVVERVYCDELVKVIDFIEGK